MVICSDDVLFVCSLLTKRTPPLVDHQSPAIWPSRGADSETKEGVQNHTARVGSSYVVMAARHLSTKKAHTHHRRQWGQSPRVWADSSWLDLCRWLVRSCCLYA